MDPEIFVKLSLVIGVLISGVLKAAPVLSTGFAKLSSKKKIYVLIGLSALWGAGALLGDPNVDALFDAILSLGGLLTGAATGYVMWGGKELPEG